MPDWDDYFDQNTILFTTDENQTWDDFLIAYYDPENPSCTLSEPNSGGWYNGGITISANASDPTSGVRYVEFQYSTNHSNWYPLPGPDSPDGKDWYSDNGWALTFQTTDTPNHGTINDADVWIRARACDKGGNFSDWDECNVSFGIDNSAPDVTTGPWAHTVNPTSGPYSMLHTIIDNLSGVKDDAVYPRFYYRWDDTNIDAANNDGASNGDWNGSYYEANFTVSEDHEGHHLYWRVKAHDNVDNESWSAVHDGDVIGDDDMEGPEFADFNDSEDAPPGNYYFRVTITDPSGVKDDNSYPRVYYRFNDNNIDESNNDGYEDADLISTDRYEADINIGSEHIGDAIYWRVYASDNDNSPTFSWSTVQTGGVIQYYGTISTPIFSPGSGIYSSTQNVTISCTPSDASIYYSTDTSDPTESSTEYTSPVTVSSSMLLRARAYKPGWISSEIGEAVYTIESQPTTLNDFTLSCNTTQTTGTSFPLNVTNAVDQNSDPWSGTLTVAFSGTGDHNAPDASTPVLANITVTDGSGSADQTLVLAESGVQLSASADGVTETTSAILVNPGALAEFTMTGYPFSIQAGVNFPDPIVVKCYDDYQNLKTDYCGDIYFLSTDNQAVLPFTSANKYLFTELDAGQHSFNGSDFQLIDVGIQTLTVTDGTISETSSDINVVSTPFITLTSPNGGETWQIGDTEDITWNSSGTSGDVKIEYSTDNGSSWTEETASTPDDGTYEWVVPNTPSMNCIVKISDTDGSPEDQSDAVFTIDNGTTPDTDFITFNASDGSDFEIYRVDLDGTNLLQLTNDTYEDRFPVISAEDSKIAFGSDRSGIGNVWTMDFNGGNLTQVTALADIRAEQDYIYSDFSPDGTKLTFCYTISSPIHWQTNIVNTDGTSNTNISPADGQDYQNPMWSPAGDKIILQKNPPFSGYSTELVTLDTDGSNLTTVVGLNTNNTPRRPNWAPDAQKIVYHRDDRDIYMANADGTSEVNITQTATDQESNAQWAGDNKIYYLLNGNIHRMDPDGANQELVYDHSSDIEYFDVGIPISDIPPGSVIAHWNFNEGSGTVLNDLSGNAYHGTVSGAVWVPAGGWEGSGALRFDGNDDYVQVPHDADQNPADYITIEAILKPLGTQSSSLWVPIVAKNRPGESGIGYTIFANEDNTFKVALCGGSSDRVLHSQTALTVGQWHHIAATYDGATIKIYIDGQLDTDRDFVASYNASTYPIVIGGDGGSTDRGAFNGDIDEVRITAEALAPEEFLNFEPQSETITVTSPNGGEFWRVGEDHEIAWTSSGISGNVKILFSSDNGSTWDDIDTDTENDGSYTWTIPDAISANCMIKISDLDDDPNDQSDNIFSIQPALITDTVTDIDGNVYQTVKIGDQWWMAENLRVTKYNNGDPIANVTDKTSWAGLMSGAYCDYSNNAGLVDDYGHLYNWLAVNDSRNIAPVGWHIPSDEEWKVLENYLGIDQSELDNTGFRGVDEGGKLKDTGTSSWLNPNTGATNESGFTALPGGNRDNNGDFGGFGSTGYYWSSTEYDNQLAWHRNLDYNDARVYRRYGYQKNGFSIRCVKDAEPNNNLIANYPFDGDANDLSGNDHHGMASSGVTSVIDRFGNEDKAFSFNGVDDIVTVPNHADFNNTDLSISLFMKTSSDNIAPDNDWSFLVSKIAYQQNQYYIGIDGTTDIFQVASSYDTGGSIYTAQTEYTPIKDNIWHHVVGVITSDYAELYIDGQSVQKDSIKNNSQDWYMSGTGDLMLGGFNVSAYPSKRGFDGSLDDIRIYNRAISQTEITELYSEGGWQGQIMVTSPNGSETWLRGDVYDITWNSSGTSGNVTIEYSTNNGSTWTVEISSTPDDGIYEWIVPDEPSPTCLVRVSDVDGSPQDQSDAVFMIDMPLTDNILDLKRVGSIPVLTPGAPGEWNEGTLAVGSVIYEHGLYKMWYHGQTGNNRRIGYAISPDGYFWAEYAGNPVYDDPNIIYESNPCVIHDDQNYKMYYMAATGGSDYYPIRLATSEDGINWTKYSDTPVLNYNSANYWEAMRLLVSTVIYDGLSYTMYYDGKPSNSSISGGGIGIATSTDGIQWARSPNNPIIPHGEVGTFNEFESEFPYVVYNSQNYDMLFRGRKDEGTTRIRTIGHATSIDGNTWSVSNDCPITLDNGLIDRPGPILYQNGEFNMWYVSDGNIYFASTANSQILTIISPNGGESWQVGQSRNITWNSFGTSGNVKIEYSTNNGSTWTEETTSTPDDGTYEWTIPNEPSATCLVKVSDVDGSPTDESDGTFTIFNSGLTHFTPVEPTGKTQPVYINDATLDGTQLQTGDEIGVYDGTLCVGAGTVTSFPMADPIVVYLTYTPPGGDPLPGAVSGNDMTFKVWDQSADREENAAISEVVSGTPVFAEGAIVALKLEAPTEITQNIPVQHGMLNLISMNVIPTAPDAPDVFNGLVNFVVAFDDAVSYTHLRAHET